MDEAARSIDKQFMWGDGLVISPVLEQVSVTVHKMSQGGIDV